MGACLHDAREREVKLITELEPATQSLYVLGCRVDNVDASQAAARIAQLMRAGKPAHVVTLGAEMAVLASKDARYREALNSADLIVPDTVGVVFASRLLGRPVPQRVAGIELAERTIARCARRRIPIYLLGAADGIAAKAGVELAARFPGLRIAGTHHGYFIPDEEADVARAIRNSAAPLVFVGMGFPQQELFIARNLDRIGSAVCIGVGGSFDIWSGRLHRAPDAVRKAGMEWFYRLVREPHRLKRQLALPRFVAQVTAQALRQRIGAMRKNADAQRSRDELQQPQHISKP